MCRRRKPCHRIVNSVEFQIGMCGLRLYFPAIGLCDGTRRWLTLLPVPVVSLHAPSTVVDLNLHIISALISSCDLVAWWRRKSLFYTITNMLTNDTFYNNNHCLKGHVQGTAASTPSFLHKVHLVPIGRYNYSRTHSKLKG